MREHVMQKVINLIGLILLAVLVMACPETANATGFVLVPGEGVTYDEKPIDNFSGETGTGSTVQTTGEIRISSDCVYDKGEKTFIYTIDGTGGKKVRSSIADGMIINDSVSINTGNSGGFLLYKDGIKLEKTDLTKITDQGQYVLLYDGRKVIEFTIAGEYSSFYEFALPDGFSVVSVTMNDTEMGYQRGTVRFDAEGSYTVQYKCNYTGAVYSFTTVIDHTPPVLALDALDEDNKAYGPVDLSDVEEGGRVVVLLNGEEINTSGELTQNGPYQVTVYDAAGNSTTYNFLITLYFNVSGIGFLVAVIAIVLGLGIYVVVSAKRLRVF